MSGDDSEDMLTALATGVATYRRKNKLCRLNVQKQLSFSYTLFFSHFSPSVKLPFVTPHLSTK